jgi:hypothetical protein
LVVVSSLPVPSEETPELNSLLLRLIQMKQVHARVMNDLAKLSHCSLLDHHAELLLAPVLARLASLVLGCCRTLLAALPELGHTAGLAC